MLELAWQSRPWKDRVLQVERKKGGFVTTVKQKKEVIQLKMLSELKVEKKVNYISTTKFPPE